MQTTIEPDSVVPKETVSNLFKNCMEFSMSSRSFQRRTEKLHNMGINAQIFASKSQDANAVLGVLVREISSLASETSKVLDKISIGCESLAKNAIMTTRTAHQLEIYQRAWKVGVDVRSQELLLAVINRENREMLERLAKIKSELHKRQATLNELEEATVYIPALVSLININVAKFSGFIDQFGDITTELHNFKIAIHDSALSMTRGITESIKMIESVEAIEPLEAAETGNELLLEPAYA